MKQTRQNLIILIRNSLWWAVWAGGGLGTGLGPLGGVGPHLVTCSLPASALGQACGPVAVLCVPRLSWRGIEHAGVGVTSGHSCCRESPLGTGVADGCFLSSLAPGGQRESPLGRLTQFRIQIHFLACAIGVYFFCKRLKSQSKIPLAGLEHACDLHRESCWFIFTTACTSWWPRNLTLLRVCHHNTAWKPRQFGCPWAPN